MIRRVVLFAVALGACSAETGAPTDASVARPCASGTVPLSDFEAGNAFGRCKPTLAEARAAAACTLYGVFSAQCNALDLIETSSVASTVQCFYDRSTGALVDAWGFVDTAGSCTVGDAHVQCGPAPRTSLCAPDGGS